MKTETEHTYDVIIIGSGLGGLVCGAILSKENMRVCLIEKNEQIGGALQTFRREGITFDTGVHYIGGLAPNHSLYQIFNYLGIMQRLQTIAMDANGFDVISFYGNTTEYLYGTGYLNFQQNLIEKFPDETEAIKKYCNDLQAVCNSVPLYNLQPGEPQEMWPFTISVKQYLEQLTTNITLQNVLAGTNLLYAGTVNTPLYVHALVVNSYIQGAYRIKHGGDQIAKHLARVIKQAGGEIFRKQEISKIKIENGKAVYAETKEGLKFFGRTFISNIHPAKTLRLTDTDIIRPAYRNRIKNLRNSVSTFVLYIVLKKETFQFQNRNFYCFKEEEVWNCAGHNDENWPLMFAMFEEVPEHLTDFAEAITVMAYMRFDEVQQWQDTYNTTLNESIRNETYQQFKKQKAEQLLDAIEIKFPNFRNCVQSYYTSTPLSYRDYLGTDDGSMYGIVKDYTNPIQTTISAKTKIPNLLLTGQNLNLHGVLGVTESALVTCSALLGMDYLLNKVKQANA